MSTNCKVLSTNICTMEYKKIFDRYFIRNPIERVAILTATSVHGVIESLTDPELRSALLESDCNFPDGKPLAIMATFVSGTRVLQLKGPLFFDSILKDTQYSRHAHFFYGGKEGVAEDLAIKMKRKYPGISIAGTYCPSFRPLQEDEKNDIARKINRSGATIVWVGWSTPKQEKWAKDFKKRLDMRVMVTVGAAFDFHTGNIMFSPDWMSAMVFEWLHRLISCPGRIWRRYCKIVPLFVYYSIWQLTGIKKFLNRNFYEHRISLWRRWIYRRSFSKKSKKRRILGSWC